MSPAPQRDNSNWMRVVSGMDVEAPVITSVEELVAYRAHPSRDLSKHNVDLPELAQFHERVVLRERDGVELTGEIYVPKGEGPFPTFIYMHGGGWAWGKAEYVRKLGMTFASRGLVVLNLDYGLAPEHPFPWAVEDAVYAARWLTRNAERYEGDGSRIAMGGASAGANLAAAAIVALTNDEGLVDGGDLAGVPVEFSAACFLYGVFDFPLAMVEPGSHAGLAEVMFNVSYLGPVYLHLHRSPIVSPIYYEHLDRFPPVLMTCGDQDSLLNQSLAMTKALTRAGVPTTLSVPAGLDHSFAYVFYKLEDAEREVERMLDWIVRTTHSEQLVPA
jgi:acetyl esterase/lipase